MSGFHKTRGLETRDSRDRHCTLYIELFIASYYMVMEDKSQDYYQGLAGYMLLLSLWRPAPSLAGHPIA